MNTRSIEIVSLEVLIELIELGPLNLRHQLIAMLTFESGEELVAQ